MCLTRSALLCSTCRTKATQDAADYADNQHKLGQIASNAGELKQRIHSVTGKLAEKQKEVDRSADGVATTKAELQTAQDKVRNSTDFDEQMREYEAAVQAKTDGIEELVSCCNVFLQGCP